MHDTLRAYGRRIRATLSEATRVLTWIGFAKPAAPPTEPIHRSGGTSEQAADVAELHDQQHVQPGKRVEIDQPNE
jgi:hypothetical protein